MAKHYTKNEILHQIRHAAKQRKDSKRIGFHAISIMCTYVMWRYEGWGQTRLQKYLKQVYDYYYGEEDLEKWNARLEEKAGFPITITYMTEADNPYKKTKAYRYVMENILMEAENEMMDIYRKYILIHFNVLMDMGWGNKRLLRNRDYIDLSLKGLKDNNEFSEQNMAYELETKVGVVFETP